ncbi:DUF4271 domain-containing protein [Winogradskyella sp. UBA3174]|uniref:DUF4271 domain-containing protein n=1 Tax=Winogradskyella sp. UBA3174 TaxID=1947785 RepID=UPI0025ECDAF1|nr:DUF4271 domain-containing protein [Winogradskyella sp. UBA3174]|tara:strand:+ start:3316 stop:3966 length:651 start_codon:yes stop_codon:yes gene_type:complete
MRNFITHNWFTIFTVLSLTLVVAAKYVNALRFNDFLLVISNPKYLKIYSRDQKFIDIFDGLLFINLSISLSIFIYFGYSTFVTPLTFELVEFLKLLFAVSTIVIIKTLLERLIGSLFEVDNLIDDYLFQKTAFKNYSGMLLLITNLFLLYSNTHTNIIIIIAFTLVFLVNLIGFFTSFKKHQKLLIPNFFYFLLYLCALEIGPYILLYKVITEYNT